MATKSFTTNFKFNQKTASKLLVAIEKSGKEKSPHIIKQSVDDVTKKEEINALMDSFLKGSK